MDGKKYLWVAMIGLFALVLLVLIDPQTEQEMEKSRIWDESWQKIEYFKNPSESKEPDLRFTRKAGLVRDDFYVSTPASKAVRRGNATVRNIFRDWISPELKGIYRVDQKKLAQFSFTPISEEIRLYRSESSAPVVVRLGLKTGSGNRYITTTLPEHGGRVVIIPSHIINKFTYAPDSYRERKIIQFPANSYLSEVYVKDGGGKEPREFRIYREKIKKDGERTDVWTAESGDEIDASIARAIETYAKQLQINHFNDDAKVESPADAVKLWDQIGEDTMLVKIRIKGGEKYSIQVRDTGGKVRSGKQDLALIKSSSEPEIDYVYANILKNIRSQIDRIRAAQERAKKKADEGKEKGDGSAAP